MAKCLNYESQIQQGEIVQSWHVSQSVDAFTGADDYDITVSGSLTLTGSAYLNPGKILATGQEYVLTYNNTTGQIFKATTASIIDRSDDAFTVYRTGSSNDNIVPNYFGDNGVNGTYAVVLGGSNNTASGASSFIGGGTLNTASLACSFIGGGCNNSISGNYAIYSSIVGGRSNKICGDEPNGCNFIGGGCDNTVSGYQSSILGGKGNTVSGYQSSILGGRNNCVPGCCGFIGAGFSNTLYSEEGSIIGAGGSNEICQSNHYSIIGAGRCNTISGYGRCHGIIAGFCNTISDTYAGGGCETESFIGSGRCNTISTYTGGGDSTPYIQGKNVIVGGEKNTLKRINSTDRIGWSFIGGGCLNTGSAAFSFIGGGSLNTVTANGSIVVGGTLNTSSGACSFIGGGESNIAGGNNTIIVGGSLNSASADFSTIVGGTLNTSSGACSFIGGGCNNSISGTYSSTSNIVGGRDNTISATYSGYSSIVGGRLNKICGAGPPHGCIFIGGGCGNTVSGYQSSILGGKGNTVSGYTSTIAGGSNNCVPGCCGFIGAGRSNTLSNCYSSIIGAGRQNTISGYGENHGIVAGFCNTISDTYAGGGCETESFIGSGRCNTISTYTGGGDSTPYIQGKNVIVGGEKNTLKRINSTDRIGWSFIGGGCLNTGSAAFSFIGGGFNNYISSSAVSSSGILGGENNEVTHAKSFIIGSDLSSSADCTTFVNNLNISGSLTDSDGNLGSSGQILSSTGTGLNWIDNSGGGGDSLWYDGTTYLSSSVDIKITGSISTTATKITIGSTSNVNDQSASSILGGSLNQNYAAVSSIGGGGYNCIKPNDGGCASAYSSIVSGLCNCVLSLDKWGSGGGDVIYGQFIGGGFRNKIHTIGNGGDYNSIIGGSTNHISGSDLGNAIIGAGTLNTISGSSTNSGILGGTSNCILDHEDTFIIGSNLTSDKACYTFMNNLDVEGTVSASMFSGSFVGDGFVSSSAVSPITTQVTEIVTLDQTTYDSLTRSDNVLYVIV